MYKIVGILNILAGLVFGIVPLIMIFLVIPRLSALYAELGDSTQTAKSYIFAGMALLPLIANLFLGIKLLTGVPDKYFKYAVICLVATFLLGGYLVGYMVLQIIQPIYGVTSQLQ